MIFLWWLNLLVSDDTLPVSALELPYPRLYALEHYHMIENNMVLVSGVEHYI
jgi:hypothetical protein